MDVLPIAITMGDPAGIGPEIVARLFAEGVPVPCLVFGDAGALRRAAAGVGTFPPVRQIGPALPPIAMGQVSAVAGAASHAYLLAAIDAALAGEVRAIVTAPISKEAWHAAGIASPGHTEVLAERSGTVDYAMMMANDELRVLLVSIHLSLADAVRAVRFAAELRAIRLAHRACRDAGVAAPRVAVAGLNPHAGEAGMFGTEEQRIIAPAVAAARAEGIGASGPWPGDTVFSRARAGEFDIVVAQYHDQGLIPVKYPRHRARGERHRGPAFRAHQRRPRHRVRHCRHRTRECREPAGGAGDGNTDERRPGSSNRQRPGPSLA